MGKRYQARVNHELEGWDVIDTEQKTGPEGECRDVPDGVWLMTVYDVETLFKVGAWLNAVPPDKPKVLIKHGAADVDYEVSPPDSVEVTTIDIAAEEQLFLEHAGVRVYYAIDDESYGDEYSMCQYWVSPYSHYAVDNTGTRDIREFPSPPDEYLDKYPDDDMPEKTALRWMIDTGQWPPEESLY
jgi:hypothetical protein